MITGVVTPELEAVVTVRLQGADGRCETVPAVIDTGFDGFIMDVLENGPLRVEPIEQECHA